MHIINVTSDLKSGSYRLPSGRYLADDINARQFAKAHPDSITVEPFHNPFPIGNGDVLLSRAPSAIPTPTPLRILVVRPGGFGDLLFLTPVFRTLKAENPSLSISVACFPEYAQVLDNNPDVDELVQYPIPLRLVEKYDIIIPLENTVETERKIHAVDRFYQEFGLLGAAVPPAAKKCLYVRTEKEILGAASAFPPRYSADDQPAPRLGVQVVASAVCRTYSHDLLAQACEMLHRQGWEIFFFGEPRSLKIEDQERIVNLSRYGLTFRQSAAILATCDVVLAPDSALAHLAGALDLPCVALYGPFPWQLRTSYHPKTIALSGDKMKCAPCFHQPKSNKHFPTKGPCNQSGRCEVLASIPPARIAAKVDALYRASLHINATAND